MLLRMILDKFDILTFIRQRIVNQEISLNRAQIYESYPDLQIIEENNTYIKIFCRKNKP